MSEEAAVDPFAYAYDADEEGVPLFSEDLVRLLDQETPPADWPNDARSFSKLTHERLYGIAFQAGYRACVDRMKALIRGDYEREAAPKHIPDGPEERPDGVSDPRRDVREIELTIDGLDTPIPVRSLLDNGGVEG